MNEVQYSEEITLLTDELWQYALNNFSDTSISLVTKQSAREFHQCNLPQASISFHLQSVQASFVSWERSDPRVSKEILKCKVLTSPSSHCFAIQSTKVEDDESKRLLIDFSHVVGLEIGDDSIVVDAAQMPKVEKKVNAKPGDKTESRKWIEQNLQVKDKAPHRIKLLWVSERQPDIAKLQEMFDKVPSLKRAIDGGLANVYVYDDRNDNPRGKISNCARSSFS